MAKKQFKAESKRLLDMMINSIYTHKEIFLRELISNASDAIDKLAYAALTDDKVGLSRSDFAIWLTPDKDARTLTIEDNGIGMTREELESNLGTIAKSGSLKFKEELAEKAGITSRIGTHTLRKTFGYHFYKEKKDIALLQSILNHSSPSVTLRYIGINQDIIDKNLNTFKL